MAVKEKNGNKTLKENAEISKYDPGYMVYEVGHELGLYGWRKCLLYIIILTTVIVAIINMALTVWILRVQDFGLVRAFFFFFFFFFFFINKFVQM